MNTTNTATVATLTRTSAHGTITTRFTFAAIVAGEALNSQANRVRVDVSGAGGSSESHAVGRTAARKWYADEIREGAVVVCRGESEHAAARR
jgi:hypothetical protein